MLADLFRTLFPSPNTRDDGPMYWKLCFINPMGASFMVVGLALVGLVVNASDLVHRLQHIAAPSDDSAEGPACSVDIKWRPSPVSQSTERQIQLMSTLMNFENNFMLLAGILLHGADGAVAGSADADGAAGAAHLLQPGRHRGPAHGPHRGAHHSYNNTQFPASILLLVQETRNLLGVNKSVTKQNLSQ